MLRSMTGFGAATVSLGAGGLTLDVRAVNHRFVEVRVRLPRELSDHQLFVEQAVRARVVRGKLDVHVRIENVNTTSVVLDKKRALEAMRALEELRAELGLKEPPPLSLLASVPDLFGVRSIEPELARAALSSALVRALDALDATRATEGHALEEDLRDRLETVRTLAAELAAMTAEGADRERRRIHDRIARVLRGSGVVLDPGRLEQEVAILADQADVSEELTRLESHCAQFNAAFSSEEQIGRKLDFLLHEMSREINTIGSKSSEADVALRVVELKAELERMREQVQNVE